ncbi:MAG TPA: hypothetical protein PLL75_04810 [Candidatus Omnitrophota bacterium]|nr:hypothetical protein [Candidatus Omnitrophota bacterium]HPS37030.1 hypothetical protein [Candidatus Omnitrophota bacterium]
MQFEMFVDRLHQLNVIDRNALEIYSDLARQVPDKQLTEIFKALAQDEARHVRLEKEIFALIGKTQKP